MTEEDPQTSSDITEEEINLQYKEGVRNAAQMLTLPQIVGSVAGLTTVVALVAGGLIPLLPLVATVGPATPIILKWLEGLGGDALAGWLSTFAGKGASILLSDKPDQQTLLEQLTQDLQYHLDHDEKHREEFAKLLGNTESILVAIDALESQPDSQNQLREVLQAEFKRSSLIQGRLHRLLSYQLEEVESRVTTKIELGFNTIRDDIQSVKKGLDTRLYPYINLAVASQDRSGTYSNKSTNKLPIEQSSFIGRKDDKANIKKDLETGHLVTLKGAPGIGKTRLAKEVAAELQKDYPDGVAWVELRRVAPLGDVGRAVAEALGLQIVDESTLITQLQEYLQERKLLLVLDNCEHVASACHNLANDLLSVCLDLRILATSRGALGNHEKLYPVHPLSTPNLDTETLIEDLLEAEPDSASRFLVEDLLKCDSAKLFLERTEWVNRSFIITPKNADWVAVLCKQLDGIPLAIELAASRMHSMGIKDLVLVLRKRLHQIPYQRESVIKTMIDWSYKLLESAERQLFTQLAIFPYDWTLEAVQSICTNERIKGEDVSDQLSMLVDQSLVQVIPDNNGETYRYRFLQPVHDYAVHHLEKNKQKRQKQMLRLKYVNYYCTWAEGIELRLRGPEQRMWFVRSEEEQANWRAVLTWAEEDASLVEAGVRLIGALAEFWFVHGFLSRKDRSRIDSILNTTAQIRTHSVAKAIAGVGLLAWARNDFKNAKKLLRSSLAQYHELNDPKGIAKCHHLLGLVARSQRNYQRAGVLFQTSLTSFEKVGDTWNRAWSLLELGTVDLYNKKPAYAIARYEESFSLFDALNDPRGKAWSLRKLGAAKHIGTDVRGAQATYEQALILFKQAGDQRGISTTTHNLGSVVRDLLMYEEAIYYYQQSINEFEKQGDRRGTAIAHRDIGSVERKRGNYREALNWLDKAFPTFCELNDAEGKGWCFHEFGNIAYYRGDYSQAKNDFEESLSLFKAVGQWDGIAWVRRDLGALLRDQGDSNTAARRHLRQSLRMFRKRGNKRGIAWSLYDLATIARRTSNHQEAEAYLKESRSLFEEVEDKKGLECVFQEEEQLKRDQGNDD